jgi:hypothetical protein
MPAMRSASHGFTGTDPTAIHHLERDPEFLIELPTSVQVLDIRISSGQLGASRAVPEP